MGAFFCTSCLFGRVANRLAHYPKQPADGDTMSYLNSDCAFVVIAQQVGFGFLPIWFKRTEHRRRFNIEGMSFLVMIQEHILASLARNDLSL